MLPLIISTIENDDDREFITLLYLQHRKLMYGIALSIVRDHQIAEDMISAAIVDMIKDIDKLRKIQCCRLRSYVASIVRNDSIDYIRKQNRQRKYSFLPDDESVLDNIAAEGSLDDDILQQVEMDILHDCILELSEKERVLLTMKYVEEKSDKEIAAIIHIAQDSVRMYLSRARAHLHQLIKEAEKNG